MVGPCSSNADGGDDTGGVEPYDGVGGEGDANLVVGPCSSNADGDDDTGGETGGTETGGRDTGGTETGGIIAGRAAS